MIREEARSVMDEARATVDHIEGHSDEVLIALLGAHIDGDDPFEITGTGGRFALISKLQERGYELEYDGSVVVRNESGVEIELHQDRV